MVVTMLNLIENRDFHHLNFDDFMQNVFAHNQTSDSRESRLIFLRDIQFETKVAL